MGPALEYLMTHPDARPMDQPNQQGASPSTLAIPGRPHRPATPWGVVGLALLVGLAGCADPQAWKRTACEQAQAQLGEATVQQIELLRKALGLADQVDPVAYCRSIGAAMGSPTAPADGGQSPSPDARPTTPPTGRPLSAAEQAPGR